MDLNDYLYHKSGAKALEKKIVLTHTEKKSIKSELKPNF
jgi:hypothetical protein